MAALQLPNAPVSGQASDAPGGVVPAALHYEKFTSQDQLGHFLLKQYHIRTPQRTEQLRGLPPMSREPMNAGTNQAGNTVENEKSKPSLADNYAPMTPKPMTLEEVRHKLKATSGKQYWRSVDELAEHAGISGCGGKGISQRGAGVGRSGFTPRLPQDHGRVDGARRACRLHQAARRAHLSLRQGSRRPAARQAELLCQRESLADRRRAAAGQER